jgi:Zn-dependent alcohol dehydrogenase
VRAALLEASEKPIAVVDDVDIAGPRPGEVLVRVTHCGVCHSDYSLVNGTFPLMQPTVLGHEAAGVVDAIGDGVTSLAPGDKVVLTPLAACDRCYWCLRGEYGCCVNGAAVTLGTFVDGHTPLSRHGNPVLRGVGLGGSRPTRRSRSRA